MKYSKPVLQRHETWVVKLRCLAFLWPCDHYAGKAFCHVFGPNMHLVGACAAKLISRRVAGLTTIFLSFFCTPSLRSMQSQNLITEDKGKQNRVTYPDKFHHFRFLLVLQAALPAVCWRPNGFAIGGGLRCCLALSGRCSRCRRLEQSTHASAGNGALDPHAPLQACRARCTF